MVFKSYLKHENLKDTAKEINELNFRDNNGELIRTSQQEVSDIIKNKNNIQKISDKELYDYVTSTFKANKSVFILDSGTIPLNPLFISSSILLLIINHHETS